MVSTTSCVRNHRATKSRKPGWAASIEPHRRIRQLKSARQAATRSHEHRTAACRHVPHGQITNGRKPDQADERLRGSAGKRAIKFVAIDPRLNALQGGTQTIADAPPQELAQGQHGAKRYENRRG